MTEQIDATELNDGFDYTDISENLATEMREAAARIRGSEMNNALVSGRILNAMKDRLEWGVFTAWATTACELTERTYQNRMAAARYADSKGENVFGFTPLSVIYELAREGTPEDVEQEILDHFAGGKRHTVEEVKRLIATAKHDDVKADKVAHDIVDDLSAVGVTRRRQRRTVLEILRGLLRRWTPEERGALIDLIRDIETEPSETVAEAAE